jgi:hypothetical protein
MWPAMRVLVGARGGGSKVRKASLSLMLLGGAGLGLGGARGKGVV